MNSAFRFADDRFLIGLLAIPVLILVFYFGKILYTRKLRVWADNNLLTRLIPEVSVIRTVLKFSVVIAIFHYLLKRKISGFSVSLRLMGLKDLGLPPCA